MLLPIAPFDMHCNKVLQDLSALTWCVNLVRCTLHPFPRDGPALSLSALSSLCCLQALTLGEGRYKDLNPLRHLTKLRLDLFADVDCSGPCKFLDTLRHLHVYQGQLQNFVGGLGACPNLKHLGCEYGRIAGQAAQELLDTSCGTIHVPAAMSSLTSLTSLKLAVGDCEIVHDDARVELGFVTHLTNLQNLDLFIYCNRQSTVPAGLSALGKLTRLSFYSAGDKHTQLDVDWQQLVSLHAVVLGGNCKFDHRLLRLAKAPALSVAGFDLVPADSQSAQYHGALAGMFAKYAPEVQVIFGELKVCQMWDQALK